MDKIIEAAAEVYGSDPESRKYLHVVLAQCGLPYRQPDPELRDYKKENGNSSLILTPGYLMDPKTRRPVLQGLPYGAKPRLLLIHLCTQAKIRKTSTVDVGHSMSEFMRDLGLSVTGGKTGSIVRFKEQLNRLAATRMQLLFADEEKMSMVNATTIKQFDVWFPKGPDQKILWPNTVTLSSEFYDSLMDKNAMPLDGRAIKGLQQSAMALDIYSWLAHRLCRIPGGKPYTISWYALQRQFGPDYEDVRGFRRDFKASLLKVLAVYRDAKVSFDRNGLIELRYSKPPIAKLAIKGG